MFCISKCIKNEINQRNVIAIYTKMGELLFFSCRTKIKNMYNVNFQQPNHLHFIGIGGISMSGLAEILLQEGFRITGSDRDASEIVEKLRELGAEIMIPQAAENIRPGIDCVIYTAAIHPDNPEFQAVKEAGIPMLTRAELLGQIMEHYHNSIAVAGTHGKTTTTSMLTDVLLAADADPTVSVGGMLSSIGGNIRVGKSDVFVAEACEYTNSFLSLKPRFSVITTVEEDHMDFFHNIEEIQESFRAFAKNTAEDGAVIINGEIRDYCRIIEDLPCKVITYGLQGDYDYTAEEIAYDENGCAGFVPVCFGNRLTPVQLSVPGQHNVSNALAVIAVARELGVTDESTRKGLSSFTGAGRRFEWKGEFSGVAVVDDYAHHPTEIRATIAAAGKVPHSRLIVAFQPHTYTRTQAFLQDFAKALSGADLVVLADIYAAREQNTIGISSEDLMEKIKEYGTECYYFSSFSEIESFLQKKVMNRDLLITMGAGDIYKVGDHLLKK